jgi:NIMA (never in mitosis gene a)-related kinase
VVRDRLTRFSLIMEYAENGDMYAEIVRYQREGRLPEEDWIWRMVIQMFRGLKALHNLKILHRDLKSANVFLTEDKQVAKLGDLNVSKEAKRGLLYTQTGTPYYASPEVWRDNPYDHKSDIWSMGCVIYEMVTLKPPFRAENMELLFKKVQAGKFPKIAGTYSVDLANLIRVCL